MRLDQGDGREVGAGTEPHQRWVLDSPNSGLSVDSHPGQGYGLCHPQDCGRGSLPTKERVPGQVVGTDCPTRDSTMCKAVD